MGAVTTITKDKLKEYLNISGFNNIPDKVKITFLELASLHGLNPFKNEIYLVSFNDSYSIITGYQVFIKKANQTGKLSGWKSEVIKGHDNKILGAETTIWRKDWEHPFIWQVDFDEFARRNNSGSLIGNWATKPGFMIRKVSIAQAFRLCFEGEVDMHGLYEEAEVENMQDEAIEAEVEKRSESKELAGYIMKNGIPKQALKNFVEYADKAGFDLADDSVKEKLLQDKGTLDKLIAGFLEIFAEAEEAI